MISVQLNITHTSIDPLPIRDELGGVVSEVTSAGSITATGQMFA